MKTINKFTNNIKTIVLIIILSLFSAVGFSQPPPPPGGSSGPGDGGSGNELGGNAPIGSGLFVLLGLGAAYGGRKIYQIRKKSMEE